MPGRRPIHSLRALLGPARCLSTAALVLALAAGASAAADASGRGVASPLGVQIVKVDSDAFAGTENAIYAASTNRVYVAYKVLRVASGPYWPGQLRVARSTDGGSTWDIKAIDPDAFETGDTQDTTVARGSLLRGARRYEELDPP